MSQQINAKKKWHNNFGEILQDQSINVLQIYSEENPLHLESGALLEEVVVAYQQIGEPAPDGSNVILVCHALTGSALVYNSSDGTITGSQFSGWWNGFVGPGKCLDTEKYCIICSNILGSCYGTTGPTSLKPGTDEPYRLEFPVVTVRDMVRVQKRLLEILGISHVHAIIGGSLGAMQVWEWGVMYPDFMDLLIPIAAGVKHAPWAIGLNRLARQAILNDPDWNEGNYDTQPVRGLALAREIAMMSYKSPEIFMEKFDRHIQLETANPYEIDTNNNYFTVENYLKYQGEKFVNRFDANTYLYLTRAMDLHDLSAKRGPMTDVLKTIQAKVLWIGISSDMLYPPQEFEPYVEYLKKGELKMLHSMHGHDAFLIEFEKLEQLISSELCCCCCS